MLLLAACATAPHAAYEKEGDEKGKEDNLLFSDHQAGIPHVLVKEAWVSVAQPEDNVDSPASWLQDGKLMVAATAKSIDRLIIHDGDAA